MCCSLFQMWSPLDLMIWKSPSPDGYLSGFFKTTWNEIGPLMCQAIKEFFSTGHMISECNSTNLVVLLKIPHPMNANDFRPISYCTVIYKCISKILCNRLKKVLPCITNPSQGAFAQGKELLYNVLLCQELVRGYNRQHISPRCIIKIDLKKAYDLVYWEFLEEMLDYIRFPRIFITWIMACVSTANFTITVNGGVYG